MKPKKQKQWISLLIAFVLAGLFLYLAVRGVSWHDIGVALAGARRDQLVIGCFWATIALLIRSIRWRFLLEAERPISRSLVFWATTVGYLGNHFLPARVGELMRTAAIGMRTGLSKAYVLATALTERMLDAGILVLISCVALLTLDTVPVWITRAAQVMAIASGIGILAIVVVPHFEHLVHKFLELLPVKHGFRNRAGDLVRHFMLGMRVFHHTGRAVRFLAITAAIWLVDGLTALAVAQSLNLPLSLAQLLLLVAALGLASAIPSTPGFVGIYQFVAVTVLGPFGINRQDSLAYIFLFQFVVSGCVLLWGLMGLWQLRAKQEAETPFPNHPAAAQQNALQGAAPYAQ